MDVSYPLPTKSAFKILIRLLETMNHIDGLSKAHSVNGSISIAIMIFDNFENTRSSEALQRFRGRMLVTVLGLIKRKANSALHLTVRTFSRDEEA